MGYRPQAGRDPKLRNRRTGSAASLDPESCSHRAHHALFACVRRVLYPASRPLQPDSLARADWSQVLKIAQRHDVTPLLHRALAGQPDVPVQVRREITLTCDRITVWNFRLAEELVQIVRVLESQGIQATCYKGPALAVDLYESLALRQCCDLDILVDPRDAIRAYEALMREGYRRCDIGRNRPLSELLHCDKDIVLEDPASDVCVELHWSVCEPEFDSRLHGRRLWDGSRTVRVLDSDVAVPNPEELLFLLSIHGQRHYWYCLKWLSDIAAFLKRFPDLDWDRVFAISEAFGRRRSILLPLQMVHDLFGAGLPGAVRSLLENEGGIGFLSQESVRNLLSPVNRPFPSDPEPLLQSKMKAEIDVLKKQFHVRSNDRMSNRIRLLTRALFDFLQPEREDVLCHPLLARIKPYYWIVQPLRLLRSHGIGFFLGTARGFVWALLH